MTGPWRAWAAAASLGARTVLAEPALLAGQFGIFWALAVSYAAVFRALSPAALAGLGLSPDRLTWYFAVTEAVFFSAGPAFRELQADLQAGAVEALLLRPVPFWSLRLAEWMGRYAMRLALLGPAFCALAWVLTGRWSLPAATLARLLPALLLSGLIALSAQLVIGCAALWLGPTDPLNWLWQKLLFLLGALWWPLALYPSWVGRIAWLTPAPAVFSASGDQTLPAGAAGFPAHLAHQVLWAVLAVLAAAGAAAAVRRRIGREGA